MSEQKNEIVVLLNEFSFEIEKNIKILGKISTIEISNIANKQTKIISTILNTPLNIQW